MEYPVKDKVAYLLCIISEFAAAHSLSLRQSYHYLKRFRGLLFIDQCYGVNHTLPLNTVIEDLTQYCGKNGGSIA